MSVCNPDGYGEKIAPSREVQFYPYILKHAKVDYAQLVAETTDYFMALTHAERGVAIADMHRELAECESIAEASGMTVLKVCTRRFDQNRHCNPKHF